MCNISGDQIRQPEHTETRAGTLEQLASSQWDGIGATHRYLFSIRTFFSHAKGAKGKGAKNSIYLISTLCVLCSLRPLREPLIHERKLVRTQQHLRILLPRRGFLGTGSCEKLQRQL